VTVVVVVLGVVAAPLGVGASTWRATGDRVASTPARSVDALGALPVISEPAFGCDEAAVLRRGVGASPASFWPSASAVRATWSSSTLANRAGGPVADPGGPLAAAPGSIEVAASVAGPRAVTAPGSPDAAPGALVTGEVFDAEAAGATVVAGADGIGADGPVMLPSAGS
jgi:hypothetical protein